MKIKFKPTNREFSHALNKRVQECLSTKIIRKNKRLMKVKFLFYCFAYFLCYGLLFSNAISNSFILVTIVYILLGLTGILLAFNASHDAVHNTLFKSKLFNRIAHYIIFNLQGVNATLWKKRHISSHHIFPNVDGCDADIDNNPFIRLSKTHALKRLHKYQHCYALFLYAAYTLHWILIKDFMYLFKRAVANMKNLSYSWLFIAEVVILKILYFTFILIVPYYLSDLSLSDWIIAFIIMHAVISIFFVLTLIISHLTTETLFPTPDANGMLPTCYYEHQLGVSLDYHATNKIANWIFGGFNSHAAHHLFPKLPHTLYPTITPIIKETALEFSLPYNELSILKAIKSHFKYLQQLGK